MIRKIKLQNWKSHTETELNFSDGINVLVGAMGAGKSSVLQAISFALFGTFSELKRKELKISDLVTRGAEFNNASVDLEMSFGNNVLQIKRTVEEGNTKEAIIRTSDGRLLAGTNPAQVNNYLKDILKIDEDVFLRTIYAKQNEIDLFLDLTPAERKARLDALMFIDKFETARKNCVTLANRIADKKSAEEDVIREFKIESIEKEIETLKADRDNLQKEKDNFVAKISEIEKEKSNLENKLKQSRKLFEEKSRLEEKKSLLERQLSELKEKLQPAGPGEDLQSIATKIDAVKGKISENQKSKIRLKEDVDASQRNAFELEKKLGGLENSAEKLAEELSRAEKLKSELRELEVYGNLIFLEGKIKEAEGNLQKHNDERSQILGEINVLKKHLAELESAAGACPVCAAELAETKKSELVAQRKAKISELETKTHKLQGAANMIGEGLHKIKEIFQIQKEIARKIEDAGDVRAREREIISQLSETKGKRDALSDVISQMQQRLGVLDNEISILDEELSKLNEKKYLCEMRDRESEIKSEIGKTEKELEMKLVSREELEDLENEYNNSIRIAQETKSKIESDEYIIEVKQERLREFEDKKKNYLIVKEKISALENKIEFLSKFKNALLASQEMLRKELISAVNEVMAGLWQQVYPYERWNALRLDASEDDYVLQLQENSGSWISVAGFASGGERMLACLVLRLAFAKVLAQNMNILILDEPTHNLDDKAINTLVEVVQNNLSGFLEQMFIVTHDEKLAEAGDNVIRIG